MVHETGVFRMRRRESGWCAGRRAIGRSILPVFVLFAVIVGALVRSDVMVDGIDAAVAWIPGAALPSAFMNQTLALLPLGLFVVAITSRRFGLSYSASAVLVAWALVLTLIAASAGFALEGVPSLDLPPFAAQLFVAAALSQLATAFVFDAVRGPQWWHAPLFSLVAGGVVFVVAHNFLLSLAGGGFDIGVALSEAALYFAAAIVALVPYQVLRPTVRPLFGLGGY